MNDPVIEAASDHYCTVFQEAMVLPDHVQVEDNHIPDAVQNILLEMSPQVFRLLREFADEVVNDQDPP